MSNQSPRRPGSSPRLRGTPARTLVGMAYPRIIPAPAGNTRPRRTPWKNPTDHPRACGEHSLVKSPRRSDNGSSPRLRGTLLRCSSPASPSRIIPAPAGNTSQGNAYDLQVSDHPRACGEHPLPRRAKRGRFGSSPRLRGTLVPHSQLGFRRRIIPAPAGNTSAPQPNAATHQDHPRACGEHGKLAALINYYNGSSPRLRGTRRPPRRQPMVRRIIPAPAGNTYRPKALYGMTTDHPRACGEHSALVLMQRGRCGSSPRLRGTRGCGIRPGAGGRIIPAPAGNTRTVTSCYNDTFSTGKKPPKHTV